MMAQKNRKDVAVTVHHLPEILVDFELLWTCISKVRNQFGMTTYTREIVVLKYSHGYYRGIVLFAMFILVSIPLGLVTAVDRPSQNTIDII